MAQSLTKKKVNIKPLKEMALKLEKNHVLRQVLLVEPEEMDAEEFVAKALTWLRLA
ncbi:MAG: hypothetical protein HYY22_09080 [Thaumarchaeota archaeon]|nr:hypothetical protein [Nitrososphaerota archaeon]